MAAAAAAAADVGLLLTACPNDDDDKDAAVVDPSCIAADIAACIVASLLGLPKDAVDEAAALAGGC